MTRELFVPQACDMFYCVVVAAITPKKREFAESDSDEDRETKPAAVAASVLPLPSCDVKSYSSLTEYLCSDVGKSTPPSLAAVWAEYYDAKYGVVTLSAACTAGAARSIGISLQHACPNLSFLYLPARTNIGLSLNFHATEEPCDRKFDHHVYSLDTQRRSDWNGGGKTPSEMVDDMKRRFASGSFKVLAEPTLTWSWKLALDAGLTCHALASSRGSVGLRYKRVVGTGPNDDWFISRSVM
jgi:hypothetical protein